MAGGILDQARSRLPQRWQQQTLPTLYGKDNYAQLPGVQAHAQFATQAGHALPTDYEGEQVQLTEQTMQSLCTIRGGAWNPETGTCMLPEVGPVDVETLVNTSSERDRISVGIPATGLEAYRDPAGTWTDVSDIGALPSNAGEAIPTGIRLDDVTAAPDNYTRIPAQGEAFSTTHTGTDYHGNPYSQPVVVVDSSNPGTLSTPYEVNPGTVTPYTHLNPVPYDIPDFIPGSSIIETGVNWLTGGRTPTELSSTNQLGQHESVSTGGKYEKQPDGTYKYVESSSDSSGSGTNNTASTGNTGWGFTSIADMFDGGGPGASGDSYTGGVHGGDTVGSTAEGPTSVASGWWGGGSDDDGGSDDGGGGSDDGTWCCTAAPGPPQSNISAMDVKPQPALPVSLLGSPSLLTSLPPLSLSLP